MEFKIEYGYITAATYRFPLILFMVAGLHRSQCTHSPYFMALVLLSFRNGCLATFAFAHASQNSGFKLVSRSMPAIYPLDIVWVTAPYARWPNFLWASLIDIFPDAMAATHLMLIISCLHSYFYRLSFLSCAALMFLHSPMHSMLTHAQSCTVLHSLAQSAY